MDAKLVNELLGNLGDRIESVLVRPGDDSSFQGVAGIGRKDEIQKHLEK